MMQNQFTGAAGEGSTAPDDIENVFLETRLTPEGVATLRRILADEAQRNIFFGIDEFIAVMGALCNTDRQVFVETLVSPGVFAGVAGAEGGVEWLVRGPLDALDDGQVLQIVSTPNFAQELSGEWDLPDWLLRRLGKSADKQFVTDVLCIEGVLDELFQRGFDEDDTKNCLDPLSNAQVLQIVSRPVLAEGFPGEMSVFADWLMERLKESDDKQFVADVLCVEGLIINLVDVSCDGNVKECLDTLDDAQFGQVLAVPGMENTLEVAFSRNWLSTKKAGIANRAREAAAAGGAPAAQTHAPA